MVDLDPYGGAFDCFDLAIKIATKGIAITFGELGHIRWRRFDYVRSRYGISFIEDFIVDNLIKKVILIGESNKKKLTPIFDCKLNKGHRVYFKIEKTRVSYK